MQIQFVYVIKRCASILLVFFARLNEDSPDNLVPSAADTLLDILGTLLLLFCCFLLGLKGCVSLLVDEYIGFAPAYYSLAFICFMASHYEESLEFLEMGLEIDPEHTSLKDLKVTVEKKISDIEGEEGRPSYKCFLLLARPNRSLCVEDEPLMDGKVLAPTVKNVLRQIFAKFDADKDGYWSVKELDNFIFATNGAHPSPQVLKQMIKNYPSTPTGLLKVEGKSLIFVCCFLFLVP